MISKFIDRETSLLEEEWEKEKGRLIILYGRRRIGKTRLLMEFGQKNSSALPGMRFFVFCFLQGLRGLAGGGIRVRR